MEGTNFNLLDILLSQSDHSNLSDPKVINADNVDYFSTKVTETEPERFTITTDFSNDIEFMSDQPDSSHLRHDFVASKTFGSTDMSLKILGIDYNLTPDCITLDPKRVLELATTIGDSMESLYSSYNSKRLAYEPVLNSHPIMYFILVVSPNMIMTNCRLSQGAANELMKRCRCGLSLERQVESKIGRILHDKEGRSREQYRSIKAALGKVEILPHAESPQMNQTLRTDALSPLTETDKLRVEHLIRTSLHKAAISRDEKASHSLEGRLEKSLDHYMKSFDVIGTREGQKRVTIFPIATVKDYQWESGRNHERLGNNRNCPDDIYNLWKSSVGAIAEHDEQQHSFIKLKSKEEALETRASKIKHEMRKRSVFNPHLSRAEMDHMALSGPGAKMRGHLEEILEKEAMSKLSFSPHADTKDISAFIDGDCLTDMMWESEVDDPILAALCKSKQECHPDAESINTFKWTRHRQISQHASLISDICTELSYEYKIPNHESQWGLKLLRNNRCKLIYRSTGSHVFFSVAMPKSDTQLHDPGRMGPEIYETDNYYISDFSSISEDGLDHFVKALPYIMALQSLISQILSLPLPEQGSVLPHTYWQMLKTVYLIYLNNKLDSEELITSIRYLYMNIFQESFQDISIFVSRLPEVLRSRLTVYLLNKTINIMRYYTTNRVKRVRIRDKSGKARFKILLLKNVYCDMGLDMSQLVNSFYFGYVVSKSRGKIGERNVKVMSKLLEEEFWFLDNIVGKNICLWEERNEPMKHTWSLSLIKYMIDTHISKMQKVFGGGFKEILEREILDKISESSFLEVATLKASAKDEEDDFYIPDNSEYTDYKSLKARLLEKNPTQQGRRPRVITKLLETVSKYTKSTGDDNPQMIDVSVWCLNKLFKKGYFNSDCFPKDQHGGDREIHVLTIMARMSQYVFEKIQRAICKFFPSDSIINPDYKETFYKDHQKKAQSKLGEHYTVCKSADATKWCQRHHGSCFYAIAARYVPSYVEPFLYALMFLWTKKRIALPIDIIANFNQNKDVKSSNKFYKEFMKRFYEGSAPFFSSKQRNTVVVSAGMWQGLLHLASTLKHSLQQFFWGDYAAAYLDNQGIQNVVDTIQGSDDSAALISISSSNPSVFHLCEVLMELKEELSKWISIWKSEAKSSVGSINLIEYNSEWVYDNHIIKPTTRWALACLETTLVEKFSSRLDIYYGILSQTIESGGSTFLASMIQLSQGYMHYMLIGLRNHILKQEILGLIMQSHLVPLGFFPLDTDLNAGLTGLDFLMYRTHKLFNVMTHSYDIEEITPTAKIDYIDKASKDVRRDINSSVIQFGNYYIWNKLLEDADIDTLEDLLKLVDRNPRELYLPSKTWQSNRLACSLKLYQPGVKSSLSSHQPNIRMMSASSYIPSRPCITLPRIDPLGRHSLYELLMKSESYYGNAPKDLAMNLDFPHQKEYDSFNAYLQEIMKTYFFQKAELKRTDKSTILVWGSQVEAETPLMSICIRAWWKVKSVKISSTMFEHLWQQTKVKYPFLRDSCEETCKVNNLNNLELYYFIQTVSKRVKKLKLQDTANKDPTLESAITRIFWPGIKIRSAAIRSTSDVKKIRSTMFSLLSFPFHRGHKWSLVKNLLLESPVMNSRFEAVPRSGKRLKIMFDFLKHGNVPAMLRDIETLKRGAIGFFSMRQEKNVITGRVEYSGTGQWKGKVCDVSCTIDMANGIATKITMERMTDMIELSTTIRSLISEFKLRVPDVPEHTGSNVYLTELGHFEHSRRVIQNSIPVKFDFSHKISVFDELNQYKWQLKLSETKLRLTCTSKFQTSEKMEYTILSDTFTSRDWDPENVQQIANEEIFMKWASGAAATFDEIRLMTSYPITDNGMDMMVRKLNELKPISGGNYDITRISTMVRRNLARKFALDWKKSFLKEAVVKKQNTGDESIDLDLVSRLFQFTDPVDSVLEKLFEEESEHMNDSDTESMRGDEDLDESVIDRLKEMMFSVEWSYEDELLQKQLFNTEMPEGNGFFSNIYDWIIQDNLGDLVGKLPTDRPASKDEANDVKASLELRYVLSLAYRCVFAHRYGGNVASMFETVNRAESSLSSFTEDYIIHRDPAVLQESITQLRQLLPSVSGILKEKFEKMILKYESELSVINSAGEHTMLAYLPYWEFFDHLLQKLATQGLWKKEFPMADLLTLRTILISECLDIISSRNGQGLISDNKRDELFASAWPESVSQGLVNLISEGLRIGIKVSKDGDEIHKSYPALMSSIVNLDFTVSSPVDAKTPVAADFGRSG